MQFFLDSANLEEIRHFKTTGFLDGITTNPSLIAKEGKQANLIEHITKIIEITNNKIPISVEVVTLKAEEMLKEAEALYKISTNICIKLPLTLDGLIACRELSNIGVKTNVTLCFSAMQAVLAAKAGATYISPFIGRLDDMGQSGINLITEIKTIYFNYPEFSTQILAASVRHVAHLTEVAKVGVDVVTMSYNLLPQLINNPLTDIGIKKFLADYAVKK